MEQVIRDHIILGSPNSKGWHPILCKVCNDRGRKGPRAAFIFNDGGCSYNCFNCGHSSSYHPSDVELSDDMITVMNAFDIPDIDWQTVLFKNRGTQPQKSVITSNIIPTTITLPDYFYPLTDNKQDDWCQYSIEYLTERQIPWTSYDFYCVSIAKNREKWYGRLIIPTFYNNNLVFYQGRDLTDLHIKKYLNPPISRDNVLYGYHNIQENTDEPIFVMEGWFDAFLLKGVAVFGNKMTPQQIQWLNRTSRSKVIIPDRHGDGHLLARQALQLGWSISTLDRNDDSKDVNASIIKHGLLFTMRTLYDNICNDKEMAQVAINTYCK